MKRLPVILLALLCWSLPLLAADYIGPWKIDNVMSNLTTSSKVVTNSTGIETGGIGATNLIDSLSATLGAGTDAGGRAITNMADPTAAQDAATKAYGDALSNAVATAFASADNTVSNTLQALMTTRDTALSNTLVTADSTLSNTLQALMGTLDTSLSNTLITADNTLSNTLQTLMTTRDTSLSNTLLSADSTLSNTLAAATTTAQTTANAAIPANAGTGSNTTFTAGVIVTNAPSAFNLWGSMELELSGTAHGTNPYAQTNSVNFYYPADATGYGSGSFGVNWHLGGNYRFTVGPDLGTSGDFALLFVEGIGDVIRVSTNGIIQFGPGIGSPETAMAVNVKPKIDSNGALYLMTHNDNDRTLYLANFGATSAYNRITFGPLAGEWWDIISDVSKAGATNLHIRDLRTGRTTLHSELGTIKFGTNNFTDIGTITTANLVTTGLVSVVNGIETNSFLRTALQLDLAGRQATLITNRFRIKRGTSASPTDFIEFLTWFQNSQIDFSADSVKGGVLFQGPAGTATLYADSGVDWQFASGTVTQKFANPLRRHLEPNTFLTALGASSVLANTDIGGRNFSHTLKMPTNDLGFCVKILPPFAPAQTLARTKITYISAATGTVTNTVEIERFGAAGNSAETGYLRTNVVSMTAEVQKTIWWTNTVKAANTMADEDYLQMTIRNLTADNPGVGAANYYITTVEVE